MKKILGIIAIAASGLIAYANENPAYPGGESAMIKYISENTRYPEVAKEMGVEGIVEISFVVNIDGSLNNLKVVKFVDPDLEKEAMRVVGGMPAWIPAEKDGTPIEAPSKVEVPFILE